jgi:hypothetical protein
MVDILGEEFMVVHMEECMEECMVDMVPTDNLGGDNKHKYNKPLLNKKK